MEIKEDGESNRAHLYKDKSVNLDIVMEDDDDNDKPRKSVYQESYSKFCKDL